MFGSRNGCLCFRGPLFRLAVMNHTNPIQTDPMRRQVGFTYTELLISVLLISILAITIGLAMQNTQKRTIETKAILASAQQQADILEAIADDVRWAVEIQNLQSNYIRFTIPPEDGIGDNVVVSYWWDFSENKLYHWNRDKTAGIVLILSDVQAFTVGICDVDKDCEGQQYIRSLKFEIQYGQGGECEAEEYVHLINFPYWE